MWRQRSAKALARALQAGFALSAERPPASTWDPRAPWLRCCAGFALGAAPTCTPAEQSRACMPHAWPSSADRPASVQLCQQRALSALSRHRLKAAQQRVRELAQARAQQAAVKPVEGATHMETASHRGTEPEASPAEAQTAVTPSEGPASPAQVAAFVKHPALIVTRNIEWGTVLLGFEQTNKYTVLDQDGNTVALMAEDTGGLGTAVGRQLMKRRRSFTATVFSPDGSQVLFRVRRPLYLINSVITVEDGSGQTLGEVRQRWHLWRRRYDLYLGRRQFAEIDGPLLAWEFVLRDENGGVLAIVDRNFQGFGKELFTDAGKYVIHFGSTPDEAAEQVVNTIEAAHPDKPRPALPPKVTEMAKLRNDITVVPTQTGNALEVARPLGLDERMAVLAAAISIDFDYFSQHSQHGAGGMMPFFLPIPMPSPPYPPEDGGGAGAGGAEGAAAGDSAGGAADPGPGSQPGSSGGAAEGGMDRDLGGDGWEGDDFGGENSGWGDDDGGGGDGNGGGGSFLGDLWDGISGVGDL